MGSFSLYPPETPCIALFAYGFILLIIFKISTIIIFTQL